MSEPGFRSITKADLSELIPLIEAFLRLDQHDYNEPQVTKALESLLDNDHYGKAWFIEVDKSVVGYVILTYGFSLESFGRDALVDELYIIEQYRSQGIGGQTIGFLREHCKSENISILYLEVENHNVKARVFYERNGFEADASTFMTLVIQ